MHKIIPSITLTCEFIPLHGSKNKHPGLLILFFCIFCFCGPKVIGQDSIIIENSKKYQPIINFMTDSKTSISGKIVDLDSEKPLALNHFTLEINYRRVYASTDSKGMFDVTINTDTMQFPANVDIVIAVFHSTKIEFQKVEIIQGNNHHLGTLQVEMPIFIGDPNYHRSTTLKRKDL